MASKAEKLFEYMTLIGKLKRVRRTGWVLRGVTNPESVSDHMYRVAMTAFLAPPPLNADKCVKMALVHDMAECIVGDLTPHDNVSKEEKHSREKAATQHMCSLVGEPLASQLLALWQEYELQESAESKFVKDLDRLDMVIQAYEYEQQEQRPGFLQEFFDSTEGKFSTETVQGWRQHLDAVRTQHSQPGEGAHPANQTPEPTANQKRSVTQASPNPDSDLNADGKNTPDFALTETKQRRIAEPGALLSESDLKGGDSVVHSTKGLQGATSTKSLKKSDW